MSETEKDSAPEEGAKKEDATAGETTATTSGEEGETSGTEGKKKSSAKKGKSAKRKSKTKKGKKSKGNKSPKDKKDPSGKDVDAPAETAAQAEAEAKKKEEEEKAGEGHPESTDDPKYDDEDKKEGEEEHHQRGSIDDELDKELEEDLALLAKTGGKMDLKARSKAVKERLAARKAKEEELKKERRKRKAFVKEDKKKRKSQILKTTKSTAAKDQDAWVEPEYNSEEFVSQPITSSAGGPGGPGGSESTGGTGEGIPKKQLLFYDSYGYDCERRDNLKMIDENTLMFISGNYLNFYSIKDNKVFMCRRAAQGYGLGHIALHPSKAYFAVGEKGASPIIVVYTWPDVKVYRILKRGTTKGYSFLNFNPDGDVLCSQGMDPDYMLTIWYWQKEKVLLRCKAFANDVFRVSFSPTLSGDLTTCGIGHIRFWKMAETFTGLKLQGAIGRFGKTEISDIQGYLELPNGKVLSGCEWGNILVWEGGLIVCEICGVEEGNLHNGELVSLINIPESNEVLSVGKDGYIRIWDVDTIDIADTLVGDSGKYVVEPTNEIRLSGDAQPQGCIRNIAAPIEQNCWYCQDAWGRIWDVSITSAIQNNEYSPSAIFYTPGGGKITCVAASVKHTIMLVGTEGGHLWIIDFITKECLVRRHYKTAVTKAFWLPTKLDPRGVTFLVGFGDGCVRCYSIQPITQESKEQEKEMVQNAFRRGLKCEIGLNQVLRYCKASITVMKYDEDNEIMYVCGDDRTLWGVYLFYDEEEDCAVMEPLACYTTPFAVYHLDLHPLKPYRMILAGKSSRVAECRRPEWTECVTDKSFYQGKLRGRRWWFNSGKSERRKIERREWRKAEKERRIQLLQEDWKARIANNLPVDEEIEMARISEEFRRAQHADDEEPIYKPEKPSRYLGIYYHINPTIGDDNIAKSFFVHMGDYDSGYIYECKCTRPEIGGFHAIPPTPPFKKDEDDVSVKCWLLSEDDEWLLFGMTDGSIRVMPRVDIAAKLEEMMKQEAEEAKRRKSKDQDSKMEDSGWDDYDWETDATTAPPLPQDLEQQQQQSQKKKRKSGKAALPAFQSSIYPYDLEKFFALPMHDPNRGAVKEMAWGADGHFLVSVGEDGSIFSYRWDPEGELKDAQDKLPSSKIPTETLEYEFLQDEEDPNMLTVEQTKQEEEREKVWGLQEEFKEDVRTELRDLLEVFRSIKQRNKEIPEQYRLTDEELKLPDDIYAELQKKLDEEVEEVFRIHEYESAETIVQMEKIEKNFFEPLLYPHIILKDVSHKIQTHTIRQKKLGEDFLQLKDRNDEAMKEEQVRSMVDLDVGFSELVEEEAPITKVYAKDIIGEFEYKLHTYNLETRQNIRMLERRLSERYYREVAWADLIKKKIKKDYIDPDDLARLEYAKANRGDFRLQASETFLGDHSTIAERRQKIINMKIWIHETVEEFNAKVVEARDEKTRVLKECRKLEEQIRLVQPFLPPELRRKIPPIYEMEKEEAPENKFDITQEEVEAEENIELHAAGLLEFRDHMNEEMFGYKKPEKIVTSEEEVKDFMSPAVRNTKSVDLEFENMTVHKYRKNLFFAKNDREATRFEVYMWPKLIEQEMLFKELLGIIDYFHCRVKHLHDYKVKMDIDLRVKHIGVMTLIKELEIAKEFDVQEKAILERLRVQKEEYHDARHKMDKVKKKMTKMTADVKKLEGELTVLQKEVQTIVGEKGRWADYLWKVFKKKVKLETLLGKPQDNDPSIIRRNESSEDSSDDSESTSQDTNSDLYKLPRMKLNVNVCPEHLEKHIYNRVVELRNRKALAEYQVENQKKEVEKVAEDFAQVEEVYKRLEGRLTDTGQDIRILQRRRQKRMNELKCMVILRLDQINCVDMDEVADVKGNVFEKLVKTFPSENRILIFPNGETGCLEQREVDLRQMAQQERLRYKNGRNMQLRLVEELKKSEARVEEFKTDAKKEMVLKFGVEVDLDKITAAIINLELLDKEILLDKLRRYHYFERQKISDLILDARDEWTAEIRENSNLKILKAMVLERHRDLDYFVWIAEQDAEKKAQRETSRRQMVADKSIKPSASTISVPRPIARGTSSSFDAEPDEEGASRSKMALEMPVDDDFNCLRERARAFEMRARELRNALCICKGKVGLPPILPFDGRQIQYDTTHH